MIIHIAVSNQFTVPLGATTPLVNSTSSWDKQDIEKTALVNIK